MRSDGFGSAFARSVIFGTATTEVLIGLFGWYTGAFADVRWEGFSRGLDAVGGAILAASYIGLPFGVLGCLLLGLLGLPLTRWIGEYFVRPWMGAMAVLIGALLSSIVFCGLCKIFADPSVTIDASGHKVLIGWSEWLTVDRLTAIFAIGLACGGPTGFWWWFLYRRVLLGKA